MNKIAAFVQRCKWKSAFHFANASQMLITQGGQASRVFPVEIDLFDRPFYSFCLGLIIKKKNKGVRKKAMIFSTAYLVEEPHKQGEKLRQTSS